MNQHNRNRRRGRTPIKRSGNQHAYRAQRKQSILPRAILVFSSFTAIIALAFLVFGAPELSTTDPTDGATTVDVVTPTATPEVVQAIAPTASPEPTEDPAILAEMLLAQEMLDDPLMILVSTANPMPDGYVVEEVLADSTTGKTLAAEAAYPYIDMAAAAANDGITLRLQSAYRSVSYQSGLFDAQIAKWEAQGYEGEDAIAKAATVVNPPGSSEHNCGLAADINCPEYLALEEGFENTDAFAWLSEHAVEYGFILRYPKDDEATTGIIYEPWHWRYVGVEYAAIIKESGLCLEDFLIELALVANGTSTSDVIKGTAAFQAAVYASMSDIAN
ncbi:MAG: M15 family metallopeptidase [Faecalibacterium sp.]